MYHVACAYPMIIRSRPNPAAHCVLSTLNYVLYIVVINNIVAPFDSDTYLRTFVVTNFLLVFLTKNHTMERICPNAVSSV